MRRVERLLGTGEPLTAWKRQGLSRLSPPPSPLCRASPVFCMVWSRRVVPGWGGGASPGALGRRTLTVSYSVTRRLAPCLRLPGVPEDSGLVDTEPPRGRGSWQPWSPLGLIRQNGRAGKSLLNTK